MAVPEDALLVEGPIPEECTTRECHAEPAFAVELDAGRISRRRGASPYPGDPPDGAVSPYVCERCREQRYPGVDETDWRPIVAVATDGGTVAEPLPEVARCAVESLVTTVDADDLPPLDDPADRESYLDMEREFAADHALSTLASNILDEDAVPDATTLLWVDQAEVYCCCPAHYHEHRDGEWSGGTEHPHYEEFRQQMHERLAGGAPCSFCKSERRREIEAQLDAQVTVTVTVDGGGADAE